MELFENYLQREIDTLQSGASVPDRGWVRLVIPSSAPTLDAAVILVPPYDGTSDFRLGTGPLTLGASGWVKLSPTDSSVAAGATLTLSNVEIMVSNGAGTQKLVVYPIGTFTAGGLIPVSSTDPVGEAIGADLSVDDAHGRIATAAGGQFFVQVAGILNYTPAP